MKIEIPDFNGKLDVAEAYLERERSTARFFVYEETPQEKRLKIVVLKLTKNAPIWYKGLKRKNSRVGK